MEAKNHFVFEWPVDQHGYELVHIGGSEDEEATLLERASYDVIRRRGGPLRYYRPLDDEPDLWRRFAELCTSVDGALIFTRQFGLLNNPERGGIPEEILRAAGHIGQIIACIDEGKSRAAADLLCKYPPHFTGPVVWNEQKTRLETVLVPVTLRDALLHQTAEVIGQRWRRCGNEGCPHWFRLGTGAATERREYCSNRCRVAAARKQRRRATAA